MNYKNLEKIESLCKEHFEIIAAYLFGSHASGKAHQNSDIDIALLLHEEKRDLFQYLDFKVDLERICKKDVDLVILNDAEMVLKHQVRKFGRLIYERDTKKRKQWEIYSRKLYQDFLHLHHIYKRKLYDYYRVEHGR